MPLWFFYPFYPAILLFFWFDTNPELIGEKLKLGVKNFLSGFDSTREGDTYRTLSGGQKQKIAFFRELLHIPKMLFIDEGTSAMDSKSEKEFMDYIYELKKDISVIMIAHRLSSLKNCDRILVLNNGAIIQDGDWDTLSSNPDSFFLNLLKQQAIT